ncbi:MAG: CDGSH iron-sulfur domain-containing protein [Christensenella sp.]|uniref:CDGSH iron-sulfur domain-containing protein n=1 Tax=Christensenella sp. TaxID=1935934 RepID=UPI002B209D9D|nr:CDGSH iron-sulfur domain-containing protein [Christensenella sp.]MEA5002238.1 CDGSH iron-sulfur domain-containing protein [Christensenella sp.]
MRIRILKDGPYEVSGGVPLKKMVIGANEQGDSTHWIEGEYIKTGQTYRLCRCGQSKHMPFCDGSHAHGFDGTQTADCGPYEEAAIRYQGDGMELLDQEELCAVARFCDVAGSIWNLINDKDNLEIAVQQACDCPSGRLTIITDDGTRVEPELEPEIALICDEPEGKMGPIWVRGGIEIELEDGTIYEKRNRVTLCRCGQSQNKPFCDAMHMELEDE